MALPRKESETIIYNIEPINYTTTEIISDHDIFNQIAARATQTPELTESPALEYLQFLADWAVPVCTPLNVQNVAVSGG